MSWRDDLRRVTLSDGRQFIGASFRGVPFFVESATRTGGRRTTTHEFPGRDDPYVEDHGRRARVFAVEGYVLGHDYVRERDLLLAALEDVVGPGQLIHPYHGVRRAVCSGLTARESRDEGGMALLSIEFTEAPAQAVAPTEEPDLPERVAGGAEVAFAASQAELEDSYDVDGLPAFALESSAAGLSTMATKLGELLAPAVRSTQELARLDVEVRSLVSQATSLIRDPAEVLVGFRGVVLGLAETLVSAPGAIVRALLDTYAVDTGPLAPATTATRLAELANQTALLAALRRVLAIEAARLAVQVVFESHEDAIAVRDEVAELLEEEAATAGDATYPALIQLRADLVAGVPGETELANLVTVERAVPVPSLLLAYQLYGSVDQEADVLARNRVRHPGFLSGSLRVLSRV